MIAFDMIGVVKVERKLFLRKLNYAQGIIFFIKLKFVDVVVAHKHHNKAVKYRMIVKKFFVVFI
jgi:hypothetical protein